MKHVLSSLALAALIASCASAPDADKASASEAQESKATSGTEMTVNLSESKVKWTATNDTGQHMRHFPTTESTFQQKYPSFANSKTSEAPVRETVKETKDISAPKTEPEKPKLGANVPRRSVSKVTSDGTSEEDVDALINQFYVAPPPETLMQESAPSTFLQTCSYTSSSHDQVSR